MAMLRRAKNDGHFFVLVGRSEGTKQITDEGIHWLYRQPEYRLSPGEKVSLHTGDYRYLANKNYLYTKDIPYDNDETSISPLLDEDEIEKDGPTLLLQLSKEYYPSKGIGAPWTLIIKLDELEEQAQRELILKNAVAITLELPVSLDRRIDLGWLQVANYWPKVLPQSTPYNIYYLNSQNHFFKLANSTPTQGLESGWRGNIFLRIDSPQLPYTWRRSRIDEQISIDICKNFYWIAQSGQEPEEWPGTTQLIGPAYNGWQLWHLQTQAIIDETWEAARQWLSYRLIRLTYPTWRLRILSPLHITKNGHNYIYSSGQQLLLRCDPPDQQAAHISAHTTLSLTPIQNSPLRKQMPSSLQSPVPQHDQSSYFCTPRLTNNQEYRIRLQGEAPVPAISTQISPLSRTQPSWLQGLSCTLIASNTQYTFEAFSNQPGADQSFNLRILKDFSLKDFSELIWELEPAGVSCSLAWDYHTLQEEICHNPPMNSLSEKDLNSWWQMKIWPAIADSSWARIIIDAGSFGHIELTLYLKPEPVADDQWWTNEQLSAVFIWLSNTGERAPAQHKHPVLPALRDMLLQLGKSHDLPSILANALCRLANRRYMPDWMQIRLQRTLLDIQYKSSSEEANK